MGLTSGEQPCERREGLRPAVGGVVCGPAGGRGDAAGVVGALGRATVVTFATGIYRIAVAFLCWIAATNTMPKNAEGRFEDGALVAASVILMFVAFLTTLADMPPDTKKHESKELP